MKLLKLFFSKDPLRQLIVSPGWRKGYAEGYESGRKYERSLTPPTPEHKERKKIGKKCGFCGKRFKNATGVSIHYGRSH